MECSGLADHRKTLGNDPGTGDALYRATLPGGAADKLFARLSVNDDSLLFRDNFTNSPVIDGVGADWQPATAAFGGRALANTAADAGPGGSGDMALWFNTAGGEQRAALKKRLQGLDWHFAIGQSRSTGDNSAYVDDITFSAEP